MRGILSVPQRRHPPGTWTGHPPGPPRFMYHAHHKVNFRYPYTLVKYYLGGPLGFWPLGFWPLGFWPLGFWPSVARNQKSPYTTRMSAAQEAVHLDPRIIFDLAAQIDTPEAVAELHGVDARALRAVMEMPFVKTAIKAKRKELEETGFTLAAKARLCFEDLLADVYRKAKDEEVSLSAVLNAAEFFRKVSGLDKPELTQNREQFSITINIGGADSAKPQRITLESAAPRIDTPC